MDYQEEKYDIVDTKALEAIQRSELDVSITTAKKYPRNIERFYSEARAMACRDEDTAASCFYSIPRDGKMITGPSIRLAEIVGSTWGNLRYAQRVVAIDATHVTAQGAVFDMEKNVAMSAEVKRRITKKNGQRYSEDMITTVANAACSVALRNAMFKVIPLSFVKDILEDARAVSVGKAETLDARRAKAVEFVTKMGVSQERMLNTFGRQSAMELDIKDLADLKGLVTAIRDGDISVDEAFPVPTAPEDEGKTKAERMANRFKNSKPDVAPAAPAPTAPPAKEPEGPASSEPSPSEALLIHAGEVWQCDDFDKVRARIERYTYSMMKKKPDQLDVADCASVKAVIDSGQIKL